MPHLSVCLVLPCLALSCLPVRLIGPVQPPASSARFGVAVTLSYSISQWACEISRRVMHVFFFSLPCALRPEGRVVPPQALSRSKTELVQARHNRGRTLEGPRTKSLRLSSSA